MSKSWFSGVVLFLALLPLYGIDADLEEYAVKKNLDTVIQPFSHIFTLTIGDKRIQGQPDNPLLILGDQVYQQANIWMEDRRIRVDSQTLVAMEGYLNPQWKQPGPAEKDPQVAVIIIDPGHGGRDSGAVRSYKKGEASITLQEKDIVLDVSKDLYARLRQKYPDKKILLTRNSDDYPSLEERVQLANDQILEEHQAIIYISVHVNASLNPDSTGFEVWHLPTDYRREVLNPENLEEEAREVHAVLNSIMEEQFFKEGIILAQNILENLESQLGQESINRGLKEQSWYVVRKANMPSVLVELGFISNREEALKLTDPAYLNKLSLGLYNGIVNFTEYFEQSKAFTE